MSRVNQSNAGRRIGVFTGSRAEYGLMRHLIGAIATDPYLELQLIVSGSHLSPRFGRTVSEIEIDGHIPSAQVPLSLDGPNAPSMAALTAEALAGLDKAFQALQPDILILLGDRYEAFAAATAAHLLGIPVAHLHGGESSVGAVDDRLRHAISQLSTWHFTSAEPYRERVIRMGHPPERVLNVGPMVLDALLVTQISNRSDFEHSTGFCFGPKNLLVTFHPVTLCSDLGVGCFLALLSALEEVECNVLFTHPNADAGSEKLLTLIEDFVCRHPHRSFSLTSLGHQRYLSALQLFDAMAGNSSSGVIEAPLLGIPVLNIGNRQGGRLSADNVVTVPSEFSSIKAGLIHVLSAGRQTASSVNTINPRSAPSVIILQHLLDWLSG